MRAISIEQVLRAAAQFDLIECMEEHWWDMKNCVEKYIKE